MVFAALAAEQSVQEALDSWTDETFLTVLAFLDVRAAAYEEARRG